MRASDEGGREGGREGVRDGEREIESYVNTADIAILSVDVSASTVPTDGTSTTRMLSEQEGPALYTRRASSRQ